MIRITGHHRPSAGAVASNCGKTVAGRLAVTLVCLVLVACGHETDRANPLDPQLSSAPALAASADDTTGFVALSWGAYDGDSPLAEWRVLRHVEGTVQVDTLARIEDAEAWQFVDNTRVLGVDYVYRLAAVNSAGLALDSEPVAVPAGRLPGLRMVGVQMSSTDATASIEWAPYTGPKFAAYQLWREVAGDLRLLAEIADSASTTYVDTAIAGGTQHRYWLVAQTADGVSTESDTLSGSLHDVVDSWQLSLRPESDFVRLYFIDGAIHALITIPDRVRLVRYSTEGEAESEEVLFQFDDLFERVAAALVGYNHDAVPLVPRASMLARNESAGCYLSVATLGAIIVQSCNQDRADRTRHFPFRGSSIATSITRQDAEQIRVWSASSNLGARTQAFANLQVETAGTHILDTFEAGSQWGPTIPGETGFVRNYVEGALVVASVGSVSRGRDVFLGARTDTAWNAERVGVHVMSDGTGTPGISIGPRHLEDSAYGAYFPNVNRGATFVRLSLNEPSDILRLDSVEDGATVDSLVVPWVTIPHATYVLGLSLEADEVFIDSPHLWAGSRNHTDRWGTILATDREVGVHGGSMGATTITLEGDVVGTADVPEYSDLRSFTLRGDPFVIATMPDKRVVEVQPLRRSNFSGVFWPSPGGGLTLGGVGNDPGDLTMPISAAASPDGRYYVLDAGSSRVQAYSAEGVFITSFGSRGSGAGQFELGDGVESTDYAGSIVVDDEGFVYVADMANRRIQKFAP